MKVRDAVMDRLATGHAADCGIDNGCVRITIGSRIMTDRGRLPRKVRWMVTAALAGGSLFSKCDFMLRSAIADGSKQFLASLLDPTNLLQSLSPGSSGSSTTP